uniref:Uncharacterized protein n=1 Tax=Oryza brachyantha TaxID=4533 RepID=J3MT44_ORYBR
EKTSRFRFQSWSRKKSLAIGVIFSIRLGSELQQVNEYRSGGQEQCILESSDGNVNTAMCATCFKVWLGKQHRELL